MVRIAIEATGCDKGFSEVCKGAQIALDRDSKLEVILVGGKDGLPENYKEMFGGMVVLTEHTYIPENNGSQRESSIYKAIDMHKKGDVHAVVAPGDTGGSVLCATGLLKRIKGVTRPTISANFPHNNVLLDVGASYESKPQHLFQFAVMGHVYAQAFLGVESPLIGLMNVGEESYKGPESVKKAKELIKKLGKKGFNISEKYFEPSSLGFENFDKGIVGGVDGFAGNSILKTFETALATYSKILKKEVKDQDRLDNALLG